MFSENIKRVLNKYQINTIYRINSKFNRFVRLGKDPVPSSDKNNVVYKFYCKCGKTYVGQTKRPLHIRRDEHKNNIIFLYTQIFHNLRSILHELIIMFKYKLIE